MAAPVPAGWIVDLTKMAEEGWELPTTVVNGIITAIKGLITAGTVTDAAIVTILTDAGVGAEAAEIAAPLIVAAIAV